MKHVNQYTDQEVFLCLKHARNLPETLESLKSKDIAYAKDLLERLIDSGQATTIEEVAQGLKFNELEHRYETARLEAMNAIDDMLLILYSGAPPLWDTEQLISNLKIAQSQIEKS